MHNVVLEGLYRIGPDNQPTPGMAKSHELSPDGKTYTFHLRENAKWSIGIPVTAKDFSFVWKKSHSSKKLVEYMRNQLERKQQAIPTNVGT